jgi:hypothetical protein
MERELYLLQDGTHADPSDVSADKSGVLRHKNGLAVCLYDDGSPQTVTSDAVRNKNVAAAKGGETPAADVKSEVADKAADKAPVKARAPVLSSAPAPDAPASGQVG